MNKMKKYKSKYEEGKFNTPEQEEAIAAIKEGRYNHYVVSKDGFGRSHVIFDNKKLIVIEKNGKIEAMYDIKKTANA